MPNSDKYYNLLLEYKINRQLYPLAEYIYKHVKENYIDKGITSNGRPALSFTNLKYLSGFGLDKPLYVVPTIDWRKNNEYASVYESNQYNCIYINMAPWFDKNKNMRGTYGDNAYLQKIIHELSHLLDNHIMMVDKSARKNTPNERNVANMYYMFNSRELEARANEVYSYFYHSPKTVVSLIQKHAKDGQLSLKTIVDDMIELTNPISFIADMATYLPQISKSQYGDNNSMVMIMATDKQHGEFNLFNGMPSARQIKDKTSFMKAKEIVYRETSNIINEFRSYIYNELAQLIKWYIKQFYNNQNAKSQQQ
jgi:hypothetical protein